MEAKVVLIRPVRLPPKVWRDNRKHLKSHFDQKGPDIIRHSLRIIVVRSGIASTGSVQENTNGRLGMRISDFPHPDEQRAFRENAYLEWMTCLSCGARWSRQTGQDDIQGKMGTSVDTSLSRMCLDDATTADDKQNGYVLRMQSVPLVQESGTHISYYGITCFTVCALVFSSSAYGGAGDGTGLRLSRIGGESFTMLNVPAEPAVTQQEQEILLEELRHPSSSGIKGQEARRAIVRMFPDKQQKIKVSKAVRTLQDTMQKI